MRDSQTPQSSTLSPPNPLPAPDASSAPWSLNPDPSRPPSNTRPRAAGARTRAPSLPAEPASSPLLPTLPRLRALLAEHPELLEAGLRPFEDEKGEVASAPYATAVGDIDVLASDDSGAIVVVMIVEPGAGSGLVSEVLQRIGWAQRHLARGRREVRGIVVLETPLERLGYSATALAETVRFKLCRVALYFDDVAL